MIDASTLAGLQVFGSFSSDITDNNIVLKQKSKVAIIYSIIISFIVVDEYEEDEGQVERNWLAHRQNNENKECEKKNFVRRILTEENFFFVVSRRQ